MSITCTPPFFLWGIRQGCPLRDSFESVDSGSLLQLERVFRPLRSLSVATAQKRVVDGLCILQPRSNRPNKLEELKGFDPMEACDGFGGREYIEACCNPCDANVYDPGSASSGSQRANLAGCYGCLQCVYDEMDLFTRWQRQILSRKGPFSEVSQLDELWRREDWEQGCLSGWQSKSWSILIRETLQEWDHPDLHSMERALQLAISGDAAIQIEGFPEGRIENNRWILPQHCSNCLKPLEKWKGRCPGCQSQQPPHPLRKRNLKGDRPYWPLVEFLPRESVVDLADRYFDQPPGERGSDMDGSPQ